MSTYKEGRHPFLVMCVDVGAVYFLYEYCSLYCVVQAGAVKAV